MDSGTEAAFLVGLEQVDRIEAMFHKNVVEGTLIVMVHGEAGAGKTTLADEVKTVICPMTHLLRMLSAQEVDHMSLSEDMRLV